MSVERSQGANFNPLNNIQGSHPQNLKNAGQSGSTGASIQGQQCYVDMGKFYGNNIWGCMDWSQTPGFISADLLNKGFFGQFFANLKSEGVNKIDLSFAQMKDIQNLFMDSLNPPTGSGSSYSATDSFMPIFHTIGTDGRTYNGAPYVVKDSSGNTVANNFMQYLVQYAHGMGIQVDLSMGGACGAGNDFKLPEDPTTSANQLASFMSNMGIDSVDFDIENSSLFQTNSTNDLNTFFSALHSNLQKEGKECTATLMGGSLTDPKFAPLMTNFSQKFDSLNLMLYSNSQYYLNPQNNNIWSGIESAIKDVGGDPSKIHIGFYDSIPYESSSANGDGGNYNIKPGSTRGQAAAQIYQQLLNQLTQDGYLKNGQTLGEPFFWNDTPGDPSSEQVMQDFYNTLSGKSKTFWS